MNFYHTTVTPQAVKLVNAVMESTFLSEGGTARGFEIALERELGLHNVVAVNSGTAALHLALIAAGVGEGDEVITSAQTFVATAHAIKMCGATPVFADIDPYTGNLTFLSVYDKFSYKTKAILPVMWAGYPTDDDICAFANTEGVFTIADAAHALGATHKGMPVGGDAFNYHDLTCFSFQAIKHVTSGDGGAICTRLRSAEQRLRKLRWFGIDRERDLPDELGERTYTLDEVGYKCHMNNFAAAMGTGNLWGFSQRLARRREIAARYFIALASVAGLELMRYEGDKESAYWLFPVLVERRLDFVRKLASKSVPTSVVHRRIDRHPVFGGHNTDLPGLAYFDTHQIHIPIHEGLTDDDVELIIRTIQEGW